MRRSQPQHWCFHEFMTRQLTHIEKYSGLGIGRQLVLLGLVPPYQPDSLNDLLLVSYPRSGNTWMRAVLTSAALGRPITSLTELDYHVPDRHAPMPKLLLSRRGSHGRAVKTHHPAWKELQRIRSILIVRNPVAVALSAYTYRVHAAGEGRTLPDFLRDFLAGRTDWPAWAEHTSSWLERCDDAKGGCLGLFRYEDLVADPGGELQRFLDLVPYELKCRDPATLTEWNSLSALKKAEAAGNRTHRSGWFIGGSIRTATQLDDECWQAVERFHREHSALLTRLRYTLEESRRQFEGGVTNS